PGAAARVALEAEAALLLAHAGAALDQAEAGHDHPGRAEAALEAVVLAEGLLEGVEVPIPGQALDGGDLGPVGLDGQHRAGLDRLAVHHDRAGATRGRVAADIGPGEAQVLPEEVDEQQARLDLSLAPDAVYGKSDAPQGPPPSPSTGSGSQG